MSPASVTLWRGKLIDGCDGLQDDARLGASLLRQPLGREDVDRHGQLLGRGVPGARAHHHVDRRQLHRAPAEGEVLLHDIAAGDRHPLGPGLEADQPDADVVGAGRHAADLVPAVGAGGGAEAGPLDRDRGVRQGGPTAVGNAPLERARLRGETGGGYQRQCQIDGQPNRAYEHGTSIC